MCDISSINGRGLLGQKINKIHEDRLQNSPIMFERFISERENDIPKITKVGEAEELEQVENKKIEIRCFTNLERWFLVYNQIDKENIEVSKEMSNLTKRSSILENALQMLIDNYNELNIEFSKDIHITDIEKLNDTSLIDIYNLPSIRISEKWQQIIEYRNIFKRIYKSLDEILKNTNYLDEI